MENSLSTRVGLSRLITIVAFASLGLACSPAAEPPPAEPVAAAQAAIGGGPPVCVTIQRGTFGDVADVFLANADGNPDRNYGSSTSLSVTSGSFGLRQGLLRFDTSVIPPDATVTSATATLNVLLDGGAEVRAHRVTAPWDEHTVTQINFGGAWSSSVEATFPSGSPTSADLTPLVQAWVNGSLENDGILLERDAGRTIFSSSEDVPSARPRMDVCYVPGPCSGQPDGTACDDGDACTQTDTCQAGHCVGSNPVVCGAGCGPCAAPTCSDGLQNGAETGVDCGGPCAPCDPCLGVVCHAPDACHTAGTCDPAVGACVGGASLLTQLPGSVTITNATSLAALTCVSQIGGTLTIAGDGSVPTVDLPFLQKVGGSLTVTAGSQVGVLSLGGLQTVGGQVDLENNPALTTVSLDSLTSAALVYVASNANLGACRLGDLTQTGSVDLLSNPVLADLGPVGLGHLQSVVHEIAIRSNPLLASLGPLGLGSLKTAGSIDIEVNALLASLGPTSLAQLTSVTGLFDFEKNPLITGVDLSNASLGGIYIANNAGLASFKLGNLPAHVQYAVIQNEPLLTDLGPTGLSPVQSVAIDLTIDSTALASLGPTGISNLVSVGRGFEMYNNPHLATLGPTSLNQLTSVGAAYAGGMLTFEQNPLITAVDASNASLGGIYVANNAGLTSFKLGNLPAHVQYAVIQNQPLLTDLGPTGLSPVQSVAVDFDVLDTALPSLGPSGISNLVSVGRGFRIQNNPHLATLGPTSLTQLASVGAAYVGGIFDFEQNPLITGVDVSNGSLGGIYVANNAGLASFKLGNLPAHVQYAVIQNQPLLTDLGPTGLSPVQSVAVDFDVLDTALPSLGPSGISNLITVGRGFRIQNNPQLATLGPTSLNQLTSLGAAFASTYLDFEQNPLITGVDVSNASLGGLFVVSNAALTSFKLGNMQAHVSYAVIQNDPLLTDLGATGLSPVQSVAVDFMVDSTALASLGPSGISNLASVGRGFEVYNNPALTSLGPTSLAHLTSVGGGFDIEKSPLVTTVDLSALTSVAGYFVIDHDASLSSLLVGNLVHVGGNLQITSNPQLPTCFQTLLAQLVGFSGTTTINGDGPACP